MARNTRHHGFFPLTEKPFGFSAHGRSAEQVELVERYTKELASSYDDSPCGVLQTLRLDLATVEPSLPAERPQDECRFLGEQSLHQALRARSTNGIRVGRTAVCRTAVVVTTARIRIVTGVVIARSPAVQYQHPSVLMAAGLLAKKAWSGVEVKAYVKRASPGIARGE